jgi:hypothetical protein
MDTSACGVYLPDLEADEIARRRLRDRLGVQHCLGVSPS